MDDGPASHRIDTLLLLGLPACGKSVIRRFLSTVPPHAADLRSRIGPTIQLDDFPYVSFMWRISEVFEDLGYGPVFFDPTRVRFEDPRVFGALVHLLNEDYAALHEPRGPSTLTPGDWIIDRLERAHVLAGMPAPFSSLGPPGRLAVSTAIADDAARFAGEWIARTRPPGTTVVIELSRGGPEGSALPLAPPYGYAYALSLLSAEILRRAVILYVWVTPEESRRRNVQRAQPGAQGSTLHHAVPEATMRTCYGMDDMGWLIDHSERPGTITLHAHQATFQLPVARFDNRRQLELLRSDDIATRSVGQAEQVHQFLEEAFAGLAAHARAVAEIGR